jgi:hypothetical protein
MLVDTAPGEPKCNAEPLRVIETEYRGFRFRSRTEARYAVFFDAAGIGWQYEVEGFHLNGACYLPDFFLPELKTYVEVKPNKEAAKQTAPLLLALKEASGCDVIVAIGSPAVGPPDNFYRPSDGGRVYHADLTQCPFCSRLRFGWQASCDCLGEIQVRQWPYRQASRLTFALGEAQRARFEFGETGKPRPYTPPPVAREVRVYAAGAIFRTEEAEEAVDEDGDPVILYDQGLEPWRATVFHCSDAALSSDHAPATGRFVYAGPTVVDNHGGACLGLANQRLDEVAGAHVLFAWVDREETIGTLAEVGAAHARSKPIFVAFADEQLAKHFYFIEQLATVAAVTADVMAAWDLFTRWQASSGGGRG